MDPEREPHFVSDEAEQLVRGLADLSTELASLAAFMRAAETMRVQPPDAATAQRHLAAIAAETAHLRAEGSPEPRAQTPTMLGGVLRSRWFKGVGIGIAAVLATGGLAAAQVLPAPAQDAIARVAQAIGIDLPTSDDDDAAPADANGDANGDGVPDDGSEGGPRPKDGLDHDGDGVPDDRGERTGPKGPKDGVDRDGDGAPDDNGERGKPEDPAATPKTPKPDKTAKPNKPSEPGGPDDGEGPGNQPERGGPGADQP